MKVNIISGILLFFTTLLYSAPIAIIDLDKNHNSAMYIGQTISDIGIDVDYYYDITQDIFKYKAVFLCLGMFDENHILTTIEGAILNSYLNIGGRLYIEGGDTWAYDYPTQVHNKFGIIGILDGLNDLDTIFGNSSPIMGGIEFKYWGDNYWVDRISPDSTSQPVFYNKDPLYCVAVAKDGIFYRTIGSSFEFSGIATTQLRKQIMMKYLNFFNFSSVYGVTYYDNINQTLLDSLYIGLDTNIVAMSDNNGWFLLPSLNSGQHYIYGCGDIGFGGLNSADALLTLKYFVGLDTLDKISRLAADVNGSGFINTTDGFLIAKRYVGLISSFSIEDIISDTVNFNYNNGIIRKDIKILNSGDVNKSRFMPKYRPEHTVITNSLYTDYGEDTIIRTDIIPKDDVYAISFKIVLNGKYMGMKFSSTIGGYYVENIIRDTIIFVAFDINPITTISYSIRIKGVMSDISQSLSDVDIIGSSGNNILSSIITQEIILTDNTVKIYPNPINANEILTIEAEKKHYQKDFYIFDNTGKKVYTGILKDKNVINMQYNPGIYFLKIDNSYKIIVK